MGRIKRTFQPGEFYHAFTSSIKEFPLFHFPSHCILLDDLIKENAFKHDLTVFSKCLMPNHFHVLMKINSEKSSISDFFMETKSNYAKYLNRGFHRFGALFANRYSALKLHTPEDIFYACRYIHANPVISALVDDISLWRYSNWHEYLNPDFWNRHSDMEWDPRFNKGWNYVKMTNEYGLSLRKIRMELHPLKYIEIRSPDFMKRKIA